VLLEEGLNCSRLRLLINLSKWTGRSDIEW
jgi:hypothetical protein